MYNIELQILYRLKAIAVEHLVLKPENKQPDMTIKKYLKSPCRLSFLLLMFTVYGGYLGKGFRCSSPHKDNKTSNDIKAD